MQARDPEDRAPGITVGVGRAILSNRISHFLNIKGPRYEYLVGSLPIGNEANLGII